MFAGSPRILILSASVGAGHLRAAEAMELAVKELAPRAGVTNLDVLTCATAAFRRIYAQAYLDLVNRAPHLLGWFYDMTDKAPSPARRTDRLRMLVQRASIGKLDPILKGQGGPWDAIINTHFLPAELFARLRRKNRSLKTPQFTVVTDFDAHGMWVNEPTDHYFVATEEAALTLGSWGIRRDRVSVTGIPIHARFAKPVDRHAARAKHGLSLDLPVVLLLAGGFGVGPIEQLFTAALEIPAPMHLCVVAGKNIKLKDSLEKIPIPKRHRATVMGFTKDMDELMAAADVVVTKPGGLTTSETLARGAAMAIVNPIPGQESRNSDYLLEHGAAIKIANAAVLPYKIGTLLAEPKRLAGLRSAARALGHPRAAYEVAEGVLGRLRG